MENDIYYSHKKIDQAGICCCWEIVLGRYVVSNESIYLLLASWFTIIFDTKQTKLRVINIYYAKIHLVSNKYNHIKLIKSNK